MSKAVWKHLSERKHGAFDSIPYEWHGCHYLGLMKGGWCYFIMDDFGNAVASGPEFNCL